MTDAQAAGAPSSRRFNPNPVLAKELKERARSPRAMVVLVIYLTIMALIMYATYRLVDLSVSGQSSSNLRIFSAPIMGRVIFETLVLFLLAFVALITPGMAAGSIVGEKERRTLPLLQVTLLKPASIVLGKLGASLSFALLLLVATAPLFAIPYVLGGITPGQVARGLLLTVSVCLMVASLGIWASSFARRTQFATVAAYAMTFAYFVGTLFLWGGEAAFYATSNPGQPPSIKSLYLNPLAAVATAVTGPASSNAASFAPSPLSVLSIGVQASVPTTRTVMTPNGPVTQTTSRSSSSPPPIWIVHIAITAATSALLMYFASQRVRAPS